MKKILTVLVLGIVFFVYSKDESKPNGIIIRENNSPNINENNCQEKKDLKQKGKQKCFTMDFRYLILLNEKWSSKLRRINVFLDKREFSEKTLSKLLKHLSKQNPDPEFLTVVVKTDWEQINFPSNCPGWGRSGMPDDPKKYDYYEAVLYRRKGKLFFRYRPKLKDNKLKYVRLN